MQQFILILLFSLGFTSNAQVTISNYTFSTNNTTSLYDTTGSITIIGPHQDNTESDNVLLPFLFGYDGTIHRFFNVRTTGEITFSASNSNTRAGILYPFTVRGNTDFATNASGMGTSATGRICFNTIGTEPNRKAIISFFAMNLPKASGTDKTSFQVVLHESTGAIDFIYGQMETAEPLGFTNNAYTPAIGNAIFNRYKVVNTQTHTATNASSLSSSNYAAGLINDLSTMGVNNCRQYSFTPPPVNNFTNTNINFLSINSGSAQYNVIHPDGNSIAYIVLDSFITAPTFLVNNIFAPQTGSHRRGNLLNSEKFYLRIYATNGGAISTNFAQGDYETTAPQIFTSTKNGNWYDNTVWGTAAGVFPTLGDSVIIRTADTVTINLGEALAGALHINGVVDFNQLGNNLIVSRNIVVGANGILMAHDRRFRGTNINQTAGKEVTVLQSIVGVGKLDFMYRNARLNILEGFNITQHQIEVPFVQHMNTPLLRNLVFATTKPINILTPVTIVERIDAQYGTITTNNNVSLDHRFSPTTPIPTEIAIFKSNKQSFANGLVNHGTGASYNVSLYYLGARTRVIPFDDVIPPTYLSGSEFPNSGLVYKLVVNSNQGVQLQQPITINNMLELQGNMYAQNNAITFTANASQTYLSGGINTNSTITSIDNPAFFFPFKNNNKNRFFSIQSFTGAVGSLAASFTDITGTTDFATPFTENGNIFNSRYNYYWSITNNLTGGSLANTNSIRIRNTGLQNVTDATKFAISYANGQALGNHLTSSLGINDVQTDRNTLSYTEIEGNYYTAYNKAFVLPVTLLQFSGVPMQTYNALTWVTTNEINNWGFYVERSDDGANFITIGSVIAAINNNQRHTYTFNDYSFTNQVQYYRIRQVDVNGHYKYSNIIKLNSMVKTTIKLWPSPTINTLYIQLSSADAYTLQFLNSSGALVATQFITSASAKQNVANWAAGIYTMLIYRNKQFISSQRFIKK